MKYDSKRMFCVETTRRFPGDLGASIVVLAEDVLDALAEVRRRYPEYTELKDAGGHVYQVEHVHHDWQSGQTIIKKRPVRFRIKPLRPVRTTTEQREEEDKS